MTIVDCKLPVLRMMLARAAKGIVRWRSEEGNALLEFAWVLPVLFGVLTAAASFSLALYNMQQLSNATSTTVQTIADSRGLTTDTDPCALAASTMATALPKWSPAKFTYTLTITDSTSTAHQYGPTTGSGFTCSAGAAEQSENYPIALKVSYAYSWIPILGFNTSNWSALTATEGTMSY